MQDGCFSLTGVDFLMSLKKVFLDKSHITLATMEGLLTWSMMSMFGKIKNDKQTQLQA